MMKSQNGNHPADTPFIPDRPAQDGREFVGRSHAIESVKSALSQAPVNNPLVICGPQGTGKTSLMYQLAGGALDENVGVLYADFQAMTLSNLSAFLWQLAKSIMVALNQQGLDGPTIEKRMLVLNPQLVFRQRFWNPLLNKARNTPLLLAWDNFDSLADSSNGDHNLPTLRAYLFGLLETDAPLDVLLAITGRVEALGVNALSPFHLERSLRLANLSKEETLQLVKRSDRFPVFEPVAGLIYELTAGHPGDTQRLCQALYDRHRERRHGQVTATDVLAILQQDLAPSDFVGTVHRRLGKTDYVFGRPSSRRHTQ